MVPLYEKALSAAISNNDNWDSAKKIYNVFRNHDINGDALTRKKLWDFYASWRPDTKVELTLAEYSWLLEIAAEYKANGEDLTARFQRIKSLFDNLIQAGLKPNKKLYWNVMRALSSDRYSSIKWRQLMLENNLMSEDQVGPTITDTVWSQYAQIEEFCDAGNLASAVELYEHVLQNFSKFHIFPSTFTKLVSLSLKERKIPFIEKVITDTITSLTSSKTPANSIFFKNVLRIGNNIGTRFKRSNLLFLVQQVSMQYLKRVDKNFESAMEIIAAQPAKIEQLLTLRKSLEPDFKPTGQLAKAAVGDLTEKSKPSDCIEYYNKCKSYNKPISLNNYKLIVGAFKELKQYDKVLQTFEECVDETKANTDLFNHVMQIFAELGDANQSLKVFKVMQQQGIKPDQKTYTLLMYIYSNLQQEPSKAESLITNSQELGLELLPTHYETILDGYCESKDTLKVLEFLDRSQQQNMQTPKQFIAAIACLSKNGEFDLAQELFETFTQKCNHDLILDANEPKQSIANIILKAMLEKDLDMGLVQYKEYQGRGLANSESLELVKAICETKGCPDLAKNI